MKKIYSYILLFLFAAVMASCGDNENFSTLHNLTDEEIAEIARQDSIELAQLNAIDADLVLDYSINITTSSTLYDGGELEIDLAAIAELFGISEEDLLLGIAGESGAPEIKGFAIEGSTHADNSTSSTTNSTWGHWWDAEGDVTSWGSTAMIYAEFDYDTGVFYVGQYPGNLTDGQTIEVIECLKYNELRVAVRITVNAIGAGEIVADVVSTQQLAITIIGKSSYDPDSLQFDVTQAMADLGVSSMDEVSFIGVNEDGSYNTEPVTGYGFWYDMNGYVGSWGDDASVYTNYGDFLEDKISIGQMPDNLEAGQVITIGYGMMANDKIVMLEITVTVASYQDPETAPTGDPEDATIDVVMSKAYSDDYASTTYDIKETLRNAFKMTTYEIHKAINNDELVLYVGAVTEEAPTYTSDAPGYWLKADGTAGEWAEGIIWCSIGHSETELYLYGGNHPDNAVSGNVVTTTYIATCNGATVTMNISYTVE